jgi:hypothetical protein
MLSRCGECGAQLSWRREPRRVCPEAGWFESGHHSQVVYLFIVACLSLGGWDVADRLEQAPVVEPVHPFQRGELDPLACTPRSARVDHLGLEQPDYRLGERVVA